MKKQIIILFLFSINVSAQNPHFPKVKISVPCTQEFLDSYKGKWLVPEKTLVNSPNSNYSQEAMKRTTAIHELVKQIYPEPMGSDALRNNSYTMSDFAYTIKYVTQDGRTQKEYLKWNQVEGWKYGMNLFVWFCSSENANEIWNGFPEAGGGTAITIYANYLPVLTGEFFDDDIWTIEGRPIKDERKQLPKILIKFKYAKRIGDDRFFVYDMIKDSIQNAGLVTHGVVIRCSLKEENILMYRVVVVLH